MTLGDQNFPLSQTVPNKIASRGEKTVEELEDVRCPRCGRHQFKIDPDRDNYVQIRCRCKTVVKVIGRQISTTT